MNMSELKEQIDLNDNQIFGSFILSNSEFALAVSFVQEVVNAPEYYTPVPLAPDYLKGLFNLRGTVIPILDLREMLNLKETTNSDSKKIAIIELDGACVGLLFDKTGEVFRNNEEERSDFDVTNTTGVVRGVFKKNSGERIVQILDVSKVFKLHNVPKDSSRSRSRRESLSKKRGSRNQCISFVVGPSKCSLPISDIQEILKIDNLSDSALNAGHCIGTIDLRGSTVPVIDFAALLKYREVDRSETATQGERRIVVMRLEKELFGLMVDSIDSIISYFPDELITFPLLEQSRVDMFLGCITGYGDTDILLLNHQKILNDQEVNDITRGHSKLYQSNNSKKDLQNSKGGFRQTYITFNIDGTYAVAIKEVKEIINYPKTLLQPPGLKNHVRGLLNLRGELVTIIDARSLYFSDKKNFENEDSKILVFNKGGLSFGLVVDSVDSIVTFAENDKIKLPKILYNKGESSMSSDLSEAIEITDSNGIKRSMLIFCMESIVARISNSFAA